MQTIETTINFIGAGNINSGFVATGDTVSIAMVIFAAIFGGIAVFMASRLKKWLFMSFDDKHATTRISVIKIATTIFAMLVAILMIFGVISFTKTANASSFNPVEACKTIDAVVDEQTGEIAFGEGWIKQAGEKEAVFTGINVVANEGVDIPASSKWFVALDDKTVYYDALNNPVTDKEIKISNSKLNFAVEGLTVSAANNLIGKSAVKIVLLADIALTPQQKEADSKIINIADNFSNNILDEKAFPSKELFTDDKEQLLAEMKQLEYDYRIAIRETDDPAEYNKIIEEFNVNVDSLLAQAMQIQQKTIKEKQEFVDQQEADAQAAETAIESYVWIPKDSKDGYLSRLKNDVPKEIDAVKNSTTRVAFNASKDVVASDIKLISEGSKAENEQTEKNLKDEAAKSWESLVAGQKVDWNNPEKYSPYYLLPDVLKDSENKIDNLLKTFEPEIDKTKSPDELNVLTENFKAGVAKIDELVKSEMAKVKEKKDGANNTIDSYLALRIQSVEKLENMSENTKKDYLDKLNKAASDGKTQILNETDLSKINVLITQTDSNINKISFEAKKLVRPWELSCSIKMDSYTRVEPDADIPLDGRILVSKEDERAGQVAEGDPLYSIEIPGSDTFNDSPITVTKNADGIPVLHVANSVEYGTTFNINLKGTYHSVIDSGSENTYTLPMTIEIMLPPIYWGTADDGDYKTLYISNSQTTKATTPDKNIRYGFNTSVEIPWFDVRESITKVIIQNSTIELAGACNLFANFPNCESIEGLENLDTSNVKDFHDMFYDCEKLKTIDVTNFNTENATDMHSMFERCYALENLDVSKFNTSNVTEMWWMFYGCKSLSGKALDVSKFDTSKVTKMYSMFCDCWNLTELDVTNFNTSAVTDIWAMFRNCKKLSYLDLSNFNTSNIENMRHMFFGAGSESEKGIYIEFGSKFTTDKVSNMDYMFSGGKFSTSKDSLTNTLDISCFSNKSLKDISCMFKDCASLTTIYVDRNKWTNDAEYDSPQNNVFAGCTSLFAILLGDEDKTFKHGKGTEYDGQDYAYCYISEDKHVLLTDITMR